MYNSFWFDSLTKPFLNPPSWVFMPVWTVLYILIFLSVLFFALKETEQNKIKGFIYFAIQLCLNLAWSPIFFYLHNIGFALFIIILLDVFIILTAREFYRASNFAGVALVPYILWVLFATYLNIAYFVLN